MSTHVLNGVTVVTLAPNLPGPAAARELLKLGARVIKVEAPTGDPMQSYSPEFYAWLNEGQEIVTIDLRTDLSLLDDYLAHANVLITSSRTESLARLGLSPSDVHARHPHLGYVAIVGHAGDHAHIPGHDLTYQAEAAALVPGPLPRQLVADFAGAQQATSYALAAIYHGTSTGQGSFFEVSLAERALWVNSAYEFGLTRPGKVLGGGLARYGLYPTGDNTWIAVAALEPKFFATLSEQAGLAKDMDEEQQKHQLQEFFAQHPGAYWEEWARGLDLPFAVLR